MIIRPQLSMSITTIEEDVNVKPDQETVILRNTVMHKLSVSRGPDSFKTGPPFVGLMWLVTGISEG